MTTIKEQLERALEPGDRLEDCDCIYDNCEGTNWFSGEKPERIRCKGTGLPTREFDAGFGGVSGEPTICWTDRFVYIRGKYDGSEWFEAIPRHPEALGPDDTIPSVGGS